MCGIAAIFAYHPSAPGVDRQELKRIRDAMSLRGPDGAGEWFSSDGRMGMGHRRLAIIDLSEKAAQPMSSQDGNFVISFNGEIYNYKELRTQMEKRGRVFRSHSDTEVLLHLYEEKGEAMLLELRGMFAFALWDGRKKSLFLARDPYGIKPLYYTEDGGTLRIASQVKALLESEKVSTTPDPAGIVGFFLLGSVPEPYTLYRQVRAVPAGSYLYIDERGPTHPKQYFSIAEIFHNGSDSDSRGGVTPALQSIRVALLDSVKHHFVSDVPVGMFLSAGVDSGSLVGLAHETGISNLQTITLAFEEFEGKNEDEKPYAEEIARLYGTHHTTCFVTRKEFEDELPRVFQAMDQPSIDGINTYFVSKVAGDLGLKTALSGLGGDELFGGYPSFQDIPRMVSALSIPSRVPLLGEIFRHLFQKFPSHPKFAGLLKYGGTYAGAYFLRRGLFMPWELDDLLDKDLVREGLAGLSPIHHIREALKPDPGTSFGRVAVLEASLYMRNQLLRDADWAGMSHSLEIRTPFIDSILLKKLAPFLNSSLSPGKHLLTESLKTSLPDKVLRRSKTGFNVPVGKWLENDGLDIWKKNVSLMRENCPWARRWAYVVMERCQGRTQILREA